MEQGKGNWGAVSAYWLGPVDRDSQESRKGICHISFSNMLQIA